MVYNTSEYINMKDESTFRVFSINVLWNFKLTIQYDFCQYIIRKWLLDFLRFWLKGGGFKSRIFELLHTIL